MSELEQQYPKDTLVNQLWLPEIKAALELPKGNAQAAIAMLEAAKRYEPAAEFWPNGHITAGHALLSEAREFERGVTAAVNASVQPILERYVERLRKELGAKGYARDFLIMYGNGGMISARFVTQESAKTVMSGPASGVIETTRPSIAWSWPLR